MSITSLDGKLHANDALCRMIGYTKEELLDRHWSTFTHPDDIAFNVSQIEKIHSGEVKSARWEKRYLHKNGSVVWVDIHTFLQRDDSGKPLHFITTLNDISAQKRVEAELFLQNGKLQQSNAEKDKFFSIIAHDLRSPLSSFLGLAEMMADDINAMSMSEITAISKSMHQSASNLFQLLENLLEWALLRRGTCECHPEKIALAKLVLRSIDPLTETARRKNIELKLDISHSYIVQCDLKMTESIFRNLISNALKFTRPGGKVIISAEPHTKGFLKASVNDTGIGMSKEIVSSLFLFNEQICRRGTDGETSSGLGLLICKEFAENQGGTIWAKSEDGKGSTFNFTLKQITAN